MVQVAKVPQFVFDQSLVTTPEEDYKIPQKLEFTLTTPYMVNDVTLDFAKAMHYAAYQWSLYRRSRQWPLIYHALRNKIIDGNHKLVYRAARKWTRGCPNALNDKIGECNLVLIKAVTAFNPWLGICFSTYAMTCLMRALSRSSKKLDMLANTVSLECFPENEPDQELEPDNTNPICWFDLNQFFRSDSNILTEREKTVLNMRFFQNQTLQQTGNALAFSKERARQIQIKALNKLRSVMAKKH